ncbi:MAG: amidohydrolase family protein [Anaerolineae bacterium]|nr:amidohydrolase family protein [Anaerolineae bacterium]
MRDVLLVEDYQPRSELVVPEHHVSRAKFPVVDAHNHLPVWDERMRGVDLNDLVRMMDYLNVATIVNLSGGTGDRLKESVEKLDAAYPGRFVTFCNVDWAGLGEPGWTDKAVARLEADVKAGARGLKIFKRLGLQVRDVDGRLVMPDDSRIADLWKKAAELGIPVLIHTADPVAFFRPLDRFNERWDELHGHPDWHFYGPEFPSFQELIESLYRLIEAHPNTTFITAHVGCHAENLGFVSQMMDRYPNFYTDISARIAELGRAPYSARAWFLKYADRILFGTDLRPSAPMYQVHFRFLETADEYFDYAPGAPIPPQGRWRIYGVYLPDEVLRKVYGENATRLLKL